MRILSAVCPPAPLPHRQVQRWFIALFLVGAFLRLVAAAVTDGIWHPDEHQQYLERAVGLVIGRNVVFWEEVRQMRSLSIPGIQAGLMIAMDHLGMTSPIVQLSAIRFLQSMVLLASLTLFAWQLHKQQANSIGAVVLMFVNALWPPWIAGSLRTLSEVVVIAPMLVGLSVWHRRPMLAGFLFALMFGVRFPAGFLIVGISLVSLWGWLREGDLRGFVRLHLGMVPGFLIVGAIDYFTLGAWFQAPRQHFHANIVENIAATTFGADPWYQYIYWACGNEWCVLPVLALPLLVGFVREWKIGFLALVWLVAHSAIAHKEMRFLMSIYPLVCFLYIQAFMLLREVVPAAWRGILMKTSATLLLLAALTVGYLCWWNTEPYRAYSRLFDAARKRPDLTGLGCWEGSDAVTGNYFHLRRNVPLIFTYNGLNSLPPAIPFEDPSINYIICELEEVGFFRAWDPEEVAREVGDDDAVYVLLRLRAKSAR